SSFGTFFSLWAWAELSSKSLAAIRHGRDSRTVCEPRDVIEPLASGTWHRRCSRRPRHRASLVERRRTTRGGYSERWRNGSGSTIMVPDRRRRTLAHHLVKDRRSS